MEKRLCHTDAVEGSENGVESAKAAGMQAVGYRNQSDADLDLSSADAVAESPGELREVLLGKDGV